jgi:hypothetical protein
VRVLKGEATTVVDATSTHFENVAFMESHSETATCARTHSGSCTAGEMLDLAKLGNGATTPLRRTPVRVLKGQAEGEDTDGTYLINVEKVVMGTGYGCARTYAGNVYCWGDGYYGTLGNGNQDSHTTPVRVVAGEATGRDTDGRYLTNVAGVSARWINTCAWTYSGATYCWGPNTWGSLGNGEFSGIKYVPQRVLKGEAVSVDATGAYLSNVTGVAVGELFVCAWTNARNAYCWGNGGSGSLGNASTSNQNIPVRVQDGVATSPDSTGTHLTNVAELTAAHSHAVCSYLYPETLLLGKRIPMVS